MAGYSGTPLPKKLGIGEGSTVALAGVVPDGFVASTLAPVPDGVTVKTGARGRPDVLLYFCTRRSDLAKRVESLGKVVFPDAMLWVAWPKKASGVPTDITEDVVREVALPLGLVDNKVCAIDDIWSGLRLVWRRERRG
ncbi:MAG: DUF3052 domain-containing protein [Actinobacteria bacterium]|nr:DUF3052 domain-containing protein [Actinomycetota bacterium]